MLNTLIIACQWDHSYLNIPVQRHKKLQITVKLRLIKV